MTQQLSGACAGCRRAANRAINFPLTKGKMVPSAKVLHGDLDVPGTLCPPCMVGHPGSLALVNLVSAHKLPCVAIIGPVDLKALEAKFNDSGAVVIFISSMVHSFPRSSASQLGMSLSAACQRVFGLPSVANE
eukprot:CAMPEP_0181442688 /NCGR_PEP_ID=MMETSP1110-20121109/24156_1 /TAXON_ID=174948 /ORGANISM="Symbiodinium sp., Strain CCMP421" /LENGTH=132 /DNA_ID=CAMNT_0023566619 /DNA_START=173 /DNA_END=572 /DNA_ORIENTATION=+